MVRKLNIDFERRRLTLCVVPVDEAWDLWICERQQRLLRGGNLAIDYAIAARRQGTDPVVHARDIIVGQLQRGDIVLPAFDEGAACPSRCREPPRHHARSRKLFSIKLDVERS
jgi:hypothetical protein